MNFLSSNFDRSNASIIVETTSLGLRIFLKRRYEAVFALILDRLTTNLTGARCRWPLTEERNTESMVMEEEKKCSTDQAVCLFKCAT